MSEYLTTREVASQIRRSPEYVTRQCNAKTLRAKKLGNAWRIKPEWLEQFMDPSTKAEGTRPDKLTAKQRREIAMRAA